VIVSAGIMDTDPLRRRRRDIGIQPMAAAFLVYATTLR
jgi:hypothetical protein